VISTVVAIAMCSAVITSQTPSGHAVFEQALAKERVEGNLLEAIRLYERVVAEFASDRALAAKALVQIGLCSEKLGRDESIRAYERVVREFADQADAVTQAQARLAALKRPAPGAGEQGTMPGVRALPRMDSYNDLQSLSPDGRKAAFITAEKGANLAVYDLASQQTKLLTNFDWTGNWTYYAVWSPDSRRIVYLQVARRPDAVHELRVTTLDGKSASIFRNEANPGKAVVPAGWLPDGSALLVGLVRADDTFAIGFVPSAGGPFTPLRSGTWAGRYDPEPPSLSPDGHLVAFADGRPGMREIHVISRDGRESHRITDHPADDYRPLWSPDGSHLAFLSTRNGGAALWMVAIRDGQPVGEPARAKDGMQDVDLLDWTKGGLSYSDFVRTYDIYTVPIDPTRAEIGGSPRLIPFQRTGRNIAPAWSPDGKYLAFVSASPAEPNQRSVVLLPNGGGEPRVFPVPTTEVPYDLRWFGNSMGLGFSGFDAKGKSAVFRLTLAMGEWKTYPLQGTALRGAGTEWNGSGSRYYYAQQIGGDAPAIVEHDLESGSERTVFKGNTADEKIFGLRISPDRRSLAFDHSSPTFLRRLLRVDIATGQARVVFNGGAGSSVWSPDGRALLIGPQELRLIPIDGGEVRPIPFGVELTRLLTHGGTKKPFMGGIDWSPDGSRLAFVVGVARRDSWLIENPLAIAGAVGGTARR
jgi:Tol biopolymer transport system component